MHPPEPIYPCYLPVLGEFNRMTPHEGPSNTLPEHAARLESAACHCDGGCARQETPVTSRISIAYPRGSRDHLYIHRLGQSQDCELRGLAERTGPGSSTVQQQGNGRIGGVHCQVGDGAWRDSEGLAGHVQKRVPRGPIGRCGKVQVIWYLLLIQKQLENSPSGLWRTPGTRVGLTPSGVQIPHSPPVGTRSRQLLGPGSFV